MSSETPEQLGIPREWNVGARAQQSPATLQVACPGNGLNPQMHDFWVTKGYPCPGCGAAL